jgi:hypothetical protein
VKVRAVQARAECKQGKNVSKDRVQAREECKQGQSASKGMYCKKGRVGQSRAEYTRRADCKKGRVGQSKQLQSRAVQCRQGQSRYALFQLHHGLRAAVGFWYFDGFGGCGLRSAGCGAAGCEAAGLRAAGCRLLGCRLRGCGVRAANATMPNHVIDPRALSLIQCYADSYTNAMLVAPRITLAGTHPYLHSPLLALTLTCTHPCWHSPLLALTLACIHPCWHSPLLALTPLLALSLACMRPCLHPCLLSLACLHPECVRASISACVHLAIQHFIDITLLRQPRRAFSLGEIQAREERASFVR